MYFIEDFFLVVWSEKFAKPILQDAQKLSFVLEKRVEERGFKTNFCEFSSILLCASSKNIDKLEHFSTFKQALGFFTDKSALHVKIVQVAIFIYLKQNSKIWVQNIALHVKKLNQKAVLDDMYFMQITKVLSSIKENESKTTLQKESPQNTKSPKTYKEYLAFFQEHLIRIEQLLESQYLQKRVNTVRDKLNNTSFSIGITGVMNAGKSTMLNALLGREILGTSVVPETANLTLIKHSKTPYAKVNFWKQVEWDEIEKSAQFLPSIDKFIKETKESFGESLHDFIVGDGKSEKIDIDSLPSYTSAKYSSLKCNLVKSVELYTDLEFVKDGVSIVDTPGLDDPVIQREEITKKYLSDCDIMVHLMNANQSATQKDVEFIIDSLTYQHISQLLIVITRIDTITKEELDEVVAYTKQSIKAKLKEANKEAGFDKILSKIKFLPIAGKLALMHRLGKSQEAQKEGYSLEKTGILEIEAYLADVLFGKGSQKATLLIDGVKKEIGFIVKEAISGYTKEELNLSKTADSLRKEFEAKSSQNRKNYKELEQVEEKIDEAKIELESFFTTLSNFLKVRLDKLKSVAARRLVDDFSYEVRKNKKKPSHARAVTMIETTMKDGIIDLVRDYRYEFQKRVAGKIETISQVSELFREIDGANKIFDAKEFFETSFGQTFLSDSYAVINERVLKALDGTKKDDLDGLNSKLNTIFKEAMNSTLAKLLLSIDDVNRTLLDSFLSITHKPINELRFKMKEEEQVLLAQISLLESDEQKAKERLREILKKKTDLQTLEKAI